MIMRHFPQKLPGEWRTVEHPFTRYNPFPVKQEILHEFPNAEDVPRLMKNLHKGFEKEWSNSDIDPLILMALYIVGFNEIHPFRDGNGRTGRLLLLLMLYRAGHLIGKVCVA